eukprot:Rhum_TRINITY_DN14977_c4_g1::Rhum_TRINITY_DN14977_c4_g1_i1::g.131956::m.131956
MRGGVRTPPITFPTTWLMSHSFPLRGGTRVGGGGVWLKLLYDSAKEKGGVPSLDPAFVLACLRNVPDPLYRLVWHFRLVHLQEANVQAACRKHRHLELERDGRFGPLPHLRCSLHQLNVCGEGNLGTAREPLYPPQDGAVLRLVLRLACPNGDLARRRVLRAGDLDNDAGAVQSACKHSLELELDLDAGLPLHDVVWVVEAERRVHVLRRTVLHQLETPVRRNEGDGTVGLKLSETHALVERGVLKVDLVGLLRLALQHELVVEPELALWHARQERLHLDAPRHVPLQNVAVLSNEHIHFLHHVNEHLVLLVADALLAPPDDARHLV